MKLQGIFLTTSSILALAFMAIAATVGIGEKKGLLERESFGNAARAISGNSVTSRAVSIQAKDAILFPIAANKTLTLETYVSKSGRGYYRIRIEFPDFTVATFESLGPFQLSPKNVLGIDPHEQRPRDTFEFRPQSEGYDILVLFEETNPGGGTTLKSLPVRAFGGTISSDDLRLSLTVTQSSSASGMCS